jgi:hypothetical protein
MFWKLKYKMFLTKGLNFYITKKKHGTVKNLNNYLAYKLNANYLLNINEMVFWTYILIFFLQSALKKNARLLLATKFEIQQKVFNQVIKSTRLQFQLLKVFTKWVGGCLSNFLAVRWFYFFSGVKFYKRCPDILVLLEKKAADSLVGEAYALNIPVVSYTEFAARDVHCSFLLFGGNLSLEYKKNNFFFFIYTLKNMLWLESGIKKKKIGKPLEKKNIIVRKKAFFRIKKNRAFRLFGSRAFNLWRSQFRFTVKLKSLRLKFLLIGKLLLAHFKMNKHFFKRRSTLAYIEKLRRRNYSIKCRKTISFCYIIERRLLVVLSRLCITRIKQPQEILFLISNGYISVNNETVKDPLHLTQQNAIIRVLKTIPRALAKVPKASLTNNLRWLFFKRARRKGTKKFWKVLGKRKLWFRPRILFYKPRKVFKKTTPSSRGAWVVLRRPRRSFFRGEPRGKSRRYRLLKPLVRVGSVADKNLNPKIERNLRGGQKRPQIKKKERYDAPDFAFIWKKPLKIRIPWLKVGGKVSSRKWLLFCNFLVGLKRVARGRKGSPRTPAKRRRSLRRHRSRLYELRCGLRKRKQNKYSTAREYSRRVFILKKKRFNFYKFSFFFRRTVPPSIKIPFPKRNKKKKELESIFFFGLRLPVTNETAEFKRRKVKKYSFFFLQFRAKKYKRRSSKSPTRKFFTNIWLVAFIFTKPTRIKKLWYSKMLTRRVLSFFCTNFW